MKPPLVVAMTGASGALYAVRLLDCLLRADESVHLTISPSAAMVLQQELGIRVDLRAFRLEDLIHGWAEAESTDPSDLQVVIRRTLESLKDSLQRRSERASAIQYHHYGDFMAPIASGSFLTKGMVICPCSGSTMSGVVHGASNNLVQRAADVHLKEHRRLVLVPRETPLSAIQLKNMLLAAEAGAVVLPAMPGWYHGVRSLGDLVDFVVSRVLDQLNVENTLVKRWGTS
ncbi:MAG: UbiX family flavin prenyltransferase [Planctomycetaceae bacterium]|nr:MAG: UbiX family flavin prenyltransferase [Planctomycetaceae bacterium]